MEYGSYCLNPITDCLIPICFSTIALSFRMKLDKISRVRLFSNFLYFDKTLLICNFERWRWLCPFLRYFLSLRLLHFFVTFQLFTSADYTRLDLFLYIGRQLVVICNFSSLISLIQFVKNAFVGVLWTRILWIELGRPTLSVTDYNFDFYS